MGRNRTSLGLSLALLLAVVANWGGCGNSDIVIPGSLPPTTAPTTPTEGSCGQAGEDCDRNNDCCSGLCYTPDGFDYICQ